MGEAKHLESESGLRRRSHALSRCGDRGEGSGFQSVEAGFSRHPTKNSGALSLFIYYTTDGYVTEGDWQGGYNSDFEGWVQQSSTNFPGAVVSSTTYSSFNGQQYEA